MCFLLVVGKFIELLLVVEVGFTVIFVLVGAVVGLRRRRLCKGFVELLYESRNAPALSVEWGVSLGVCVVGVLAVLWVRGGSVVFIVRDLAFCSFVDLLHVFFITVLARVFV